MMIIFLGEMDLGHVLNIVKGAAEYGAYIGLMHVMDQHVFGGETPMAMALVYAPLGAYATADGLARAVFNSPLLNLPEDTIEGTLIEQVDPAPSPTLNYSPETS